MQIKFSKYHGTGNDFIIIDARFLDIDLSAKEISSLCKRRFGIGADGLILIKNTAEAHFFMDYYNSDGSGSTLCGNGSRCAIQFVKDEGIVITNKIKFLASDGIHDAEIYKDKTVGIKMQDLHKIDKVKGNYFCNTGSPHYISFIENTSKYKVYEEGQNIRYSEEYKKDGTNVNFIQITGIDSLNIRTYERGVEAETYSCGTGAVASTIAFAEHCSLQEAKIKLTTLGGKLTVSFNKEKGAYRNIWLSGPAQKTFEGSIQIS